MKFSANNLKELVFPRRCVACDRALTGKEHGICSDCKTKVRFVSKNCCVICGRSVDNREELCISCGKYRHSFQGGRFPLSYEWIGDSVFRFKYSNRPEYGEYYAKCIVEHCSEWIEAVSADALIPVPLHNKRLAVRGYNQAEVLAEEISKLTKIPVEKNLVERIRNTVPQKRFDRKGRQINVKKAFIVKQNSVKLETVFIVDDIFTTGSTIDALSEVLKAAGVKKTYFLTITAAGT